MYACFIYIYIYTCILMCIYIYICICVHAYMLKHRLLLLSCVAADVSLDVEINICNPVQKHWTLK